MSLTACAKKATGVSSCRTCLGHPRVARGEARLESGSRGDTARHGEDSRLSQQAGFCWNRFLVENALYRFSAEISVWGGQGVDFCQEWEQQRGDGWVGGWWSTPSLAGVGR